MQAGWRQRTARAFQFWHQLLVAWDQTPDGRGRYTELITHLKRFERKSADTFRYLVSRGADPVYLLQVLLTLCADQQGKPHSGYPQVQTQTKSGSLSDPRDFHFITESEFRTLEAALPSYEKAGLSVDQALLTLLREGFESLPEPPRGEAFHAEKAILHTEFTFKAPDKPAGKGRPGEHYFNTAMVLLTRHLEHTTPTAARYHSIPLLLNAYGPASFAASPLSRETVRQRIRVSRERVADYCQAFERWFARWKETLHEHPVPFNPWTG